MTQVPPLSRSSPAQHGLQRRMARLARRGSGRLVIAPIDDSLLAGPFDGLEDLQGRAEQYAHSDCMPDGVVGYRAASALLAHLAPEVPYILNLSASSTLGVHVEKTIIAQVEDAIRCGADAVAVHVNFTSRFERDQVAALGAITSEAGQLGVPVFGILYPRREVDGRDDNYEELRKHDPDRWTRMVAHAVRIGVELGCSIIKTQPAADPERFSQVVRAASGVPVLIAGGVPLAPDGFVRRISDSLDGGGAGVSFGRNFFNRPDSRPWLSAAIRLIHGLADRKETLEWLKAQVAS